MSFFLPQQYLIGLDNVGNNNVAHANIPSGAITYQELYLVGFNSSGAVVTAAQLAAELSGRVRLKIGSSNIYDVSVSAMQMLQQYYGRGNASLSGVMPFLIERNLMRSAGMEYALSIGTQNLKDFRIEVDCGTLTNISRLALYAKVDNRSKPFGWHRRILMTPVTWGSGAGRFSDNKVNTFGESTDAAYTAFHIPDASSYLQSFTVKNNNFLHIDNVNVEVLKTISREDNRIPQTGYVHVPFDISDTAAGSLNLGGARNFVVEGETVTGALGSFELITESYHGIPKELQPKRG